MTKEKDLKKSNPQKWFIDALEAEYWETAETMRAKGSKQPDGFAMYTHALCAARSCIYWVNGDPAKFKFPDWYEGQRLQKACAWLKETTRTKRDSKKERPAQVAKLRELWPEYRDKCGGLHVSLEVVECTWEGLVGTFDAPQEDKPNPSERAVSLPRFNTRLSESFYLVSLSIVYINDKLGRKLMDLKD